MKMINCPLNGLRNSSEFVYGGEVKDMPDHRNCSDREWAEYIFFHDNAVAVVTEWWLHAPSSYWFIGERHTASDEFLRTYDPSERFNTRVEFAVPVVESEK
ncbi:MAG: sarcosine oxidase subunit delta [Pseudomonadales bacterium]|nr:sarcosine oxidase subunit delta [Pseudomonadales bacterium]NRA16977.1 sarcosine oxidase subunit delta [Oceanospirillaceae bacterium]